MAISSNSWFSNAIVGVPQIGDDIDIYREDTSPTRAIGTKYERQDGAVFRYVHFGATVDSAGLVLATDLSESSVTMTPAAFVASSSTYQVPNEPAGTYPNMKGSKYMIITKATVTADDYAGGYITLSSGNSATSHTYRIKGNTATGDPSSGNIRIQLYDKLQAGINSSQSYSIMGCKYANLEASNAATGTDMVAAGVSLIKVTTAGDYGWILTKGIVGVLSDASTLLAGRAVQMSTTTVGAVAPALAVISTLTSTAYGARIDPIIGYSCVNSTAATFVPVYVDVE